MKTYTIEIDGKKVTVEEGQYLLKAAQNAGAKIPTLCSMDGLEPYGACRFCMVEVEKGGRKRLVASCCYQVEEGIVVRTETDEIVKIRKILTELLMAVSPIGDHMKIAKKYGITESRFKLDENLESPCTLCGLCVRYAKEVAKCDAVTFLGRGVNRRVALVPGVSDKCGRCRKCFEVCDAGKLVYMVDKVLD
jgi:bidirectional [NiFe] hydrogenase diaphorase subunit